MEFDALAALHSPLLPILRQVLVAAPLPRTGVVLDLACGPGLKTGLLADACGPGVRLIGIDRDALAIRAATNNLRPTTNDQGRPLAFVVRPTSFVGIVGDALALPLRDACCAAVFCIAALGLFANPPAALREIRRVLRPGSLALVLVATQLWAPVIRWPADIAVRLADAYAQALAEGHAPLPAAPDLGGDLANLLDDAGFSAPLIRAFLLDPMLRQDERQKACDLILTDNGQSTIGNPLASELPLLPWPALRSLLADRLTFDELAFGDRLAAESDIEICTLALVAQA